MPTYGPILAANDIIEVVAVCKTTDQIGLNIFHYAVSGIGALSLAIDSLEAFGTPFSSSLKACISSSAEFRGYLIRRLFPFADRTIYFQDRRGTGVGGVAGDMLPRQVSGLISKRVTIPGRRKGGRQYIPFPGEGDNDATSIPTAGYVVRLDAHAFNCGQSLTSGPTFGANPVIITQGLAGGVPILVGSRLVTQVTASTRWATQRRRGSYGRTNLSPL